MRQLVAADVVMVNSSLNRRGISTLQLLMLIALLVICLLILIGLGVLLDEPIEDEYSGVAFSADGTRYAAVGSHFAGRGFTDALTTWDVSTQKRVFQVDVGQDSTKVVAFSPDGNVIATVGQGYSKAPGSVRLWDAATGRALLTLRGHTSNVWDAVFSPDGSTIATCGHDKSLILWDAEAGSIKQRIETESPLTTLTYSPGGKLLAAGTGIPWGNSPGIVFVWDATTLEQIETLRASTERATSVAFSSDGNYLAVGTADNAAGIWNVASWELEQTLGNPHGYEIAVFSVAFSPDGKALVTGHDDMVRLWNTDTWEIRWAVEDELGWVSSLSFSRNGDTVAVSCDDGFQENDTRKFFKVSDGSPITWVDENPTNYVYEVSKWTGFLLIAASLVGGWAWGLRRLLKTQAARDETPRKNEELSPKTVAESEVLHIQKADVSLAAVISGFGIYFYVPGIRGAIFGLFPGIALRSRKLALKGLTLGAALDILYFILWPIVAMLLGMFWEPRASYSPFLTEWLPSGGMVATHMGSPWPNGLQFAINIMVWVSLETLVWIALWPKNGNAVTMKILLAANSAAAFSALILWVVTPLDGWWHHGAAPFGDLSMEPWMAVYLSVFPLSALFAALVLKRLTRTARFATGHRAAV